MSSVDWGHKKGTKIGTGGEQLVSEDKRRWNLLHIRSDSGSQGLSQGWQVA